MTIIPVFLPALEWIPAPPSNYTSRPAGAVVERIVLHRWASPLGSNAETKQHYEGVIAEFKNPSVQLSSHVVFPGSGDPGRAVQMVAWHDSAYTEAAFNGTSISIESADNIWFARDQVGKQVLARCVAFLLKKHNLPAVYSIEKGFCRHADLGQLGGGHTQCPTTDMTVWHDFIDRVQAEYKRGAFRSTWGR